MCTNIFYKYVCNYCRKVFDMDYSKIKPNSREILNICPFCKDEDVEKLFPIAAISICNTISLNIYKIDYSEDEVLIGINNETPEWSKIYYSFDENSEDTEPHVKYGETLYCLNEAMIYLK